MKIRIVITIATLIIGSTVVFAQGKTENQLIKKNIQQTDSIYYACVPCCKPCSVFTTNKPGECPHCGMVLEKRTYQANTGKKKKDFKINNSACKSPEEKKNKK
ncbi:MAG: hypothetical protein H6587_10135 [Flavobacteriales bacterium]|nr:hypothetical protein [Flavobacteriales bacterium]